MIFIFCKIPRAAQQMESWELHVFMALLNFGPMSDKFGFNMGERGDREIPYRFFTLLEKRKSEYFKQRPLSCG